MTFSSTIDDNWADSLEVPISTEIAMQKLHAIVNLATFGHDGVVLSGGPLEHIDAEVEPTPTPIDNWARGAGNNSYSLADIIFTIFVKFLFDMWRLLRT